MVIVAASTAACAAVNSVIIVCMGDILSYWLSVVVCADQDICLSILCDERCPHSFASTCWFFGRVNVEYVYYKTAGIASKNRGCLVLVSYVSSEDCHGGSSCPSFGLIKVFFFT